MTLGTRTTLAAAALLPLAVVVALPAQAQQARISKLTDVAFGTVTNFSADLTNAQSICVYSTGTSRRTSNQ